MSGMRRFQDRDVCGTRHAIDRKGGMSCHHAVAKLSSSEKGACCVWRRGGGRLSLLYIKEQDSVTGMHVFDEP